MGIKRRVTKVSLILCVLVGLAIASMFWHGNAPEGNGSSGIGIFLAKPAFAQEAEASFLDKEAGIAAYVNLGQKIDLADAKTVFRIVEKETSTYIVGSVPVPGYEDKEEEDIHCFVHRDGWIVSYYLRHEITSKIMHWNHWNGKTIGTKVEEALISVIGATGLSPTGVKYYHFKYPDAGKLMMIADTNNFKLTIPSELVIHERSYSANGQWLYIDGQQIGLYTGLITLGQLKPDVSHTIKSKHVVIVLVLQEL